MTSYYIKFLDKNEETIASRRTHSFKVFMNFYRREVRQLGRIYIRFTYGMAVNNGGEKVKFINEGEYPTKKATLLAIKAFHEVEWTDDV